MKDPKQFTKLSRFISLVLRHKPQEIGLTLDSNGWVSTARLIEKMCKYGKNIDFKTLELVVETNNKKRFAFNEDKSLIRANQGHSVKVNLGYSVKTPPLVLYHGTAATSVGSIYKSGIQKCKRHHVHLSKDIETARSVGQRHGIPVIFEVDTVAMTKNGFEFYESDNGVWLVDTVPVVYLQKLDK